jgi:hypothetical protein
MPLQSGARIHLIEGGLSRRANDASQHPFEMSITGAVIIPLNTKSDYTDIFPGGSLQYVGIAIRGIR